MPQNNVSHGKEICQWCDGCGTLVLGRRCSICGSPGRTFEINSPGDIRPCMGESADTVLGLFRRTFGTSLPLEGRMMFFNKVPGEDRTDELIFQGEVIGVVRFDLRSDSLGIELRQPGADIMKDAATKNVVVFGGISGHLKGKSVPGANITDVMGDFREGDPIIARKAGKAGPGVALADSGSLGSAEKAIRIRDLNSATPRPSGPPSDRDTFVRANRDHLEALESIAVNEIADFVKGRKQPVTVSFSGGKDSLAAYGLASAAVRDPDLLFINTGLEFPETVRYVRDFASRHGSRLRVADAGNAFWDNVDTFGPPAKDFRWCCKVCKLGPMTELISRDFPNGTITVEGNRALESFARSGIGFVSKNPFVPNQTNLNPVRSWSAAEIWGYIWMRGLEFNPLYERDFERIGCYLCASCLASEWRNTGRIHPGKYAEWERYLHGYAEEHGLPKEYADMGFWRWKVLPPKMRLLAEGLDLRTEPSGGDRMSIKMLKGASSCTAGGYSMEALVRIPRARDFSYVEDSLRTVGDAKYSPEFEIAMLTVTGGRAKLFGGGQVSVTADSAQDAKRVFERAVKSLMRAELCTECGICAKGCSKHAIRISGGMRVDRDRCDSCGRCEASCMVVHYFDKIMKGRDGGRSREAAGSGRDRRDEAGKVPHAQEPAKGSRSRG